MVKVQSLFDGINIIKQELKTVPSKPGIYKMLDYEYKTLYIGKAKNLFKRITFYTQPNRLNTRLSNMIKRIMCIEVEITSSEIEALLLESNLIKKFQPLFNILLKDDKSFSSIFISTGHNYPQVLSHRGPKNKNGEYFGPFISKGAINKTIETIQKAFLIRNCTDSIFSTRKRPCLQFQIKRCSAPCVKYINNIDYNKRVKDTLNFLSGKTTKIKENIANQMRIESDKQNYEKAAIYRNRLQALSEITAYQTINNENFEDLDVLVLKKKNRYAVIQITIFRSGSNYGSIPFFPKINEEDTAEEIMEAFICQFYNKNSSPKLILVNFFPKEKKLIEEYLYNISKHKTIIQIPKKGLKNKILLTSEKNALEILNRKIYEKASNKNNLDTFKEKFNLKAEINKIEVYDNSHMQGKNSVGAMIVFSSDGFVKPLYRKFNFTNSHLNLNAQAKEKINNDYLMMEEMIKRRFQSKTNIEFPEVIIIDGGKGHLSVVSKIIEKLEIKNLFILAVAKGKKRNAGEEKFFIEKNLNINLEKNHPLRFFIQNLRDEAHRFAIGSHRSKRKKSLFLNPLDEISGIGKKRKQNLLNHFGSAKAVKKASLNDLLQVPNLNKKTAETVYNFFNDS